MKYEKLMFHPFEILPSDECMYRDVCNIFVVPDVRREISERVRERSVATQRAQGTRNERYGERCGGARDRGANG